MERDQKVALLAIGVNLGLFGMKYLFAWLSGSMALKAEAFHSLSDVISSSTVFTGLIIVADFLTRVKLIDLEDYKLCILLY